MMRRLSIGIVWPCIATFSTFLMTTVAVADPVRADVSDDHVVARVGIIEGEVTITAGRLRAYVASRPDDTRPARALLQDLIDWELLAARARAVGIDRDREARQEWAPVMVARYLRDSFEPSITRDTIPDQYLRDAYRQTLRHFQRPELRAADHILVTVGGKRPEDPASDEQARALAERIRADLDVEPAADEAAFRARAERYVTEAEALGLEVRAEDLRRFALDGRYDPAFTAVAFALDAPGQLSAPFPTDFGHHVVRIREVLDARNQSFVDAQPELREQVLSAARRRELELHVIEIARARGAKVNFLPVEALLDTEDAVTQD